MSSRRDLLRALAAGALLAGFHPHAGAAARVVETMSETTRARLADHIRHWDRLGIHRTGTEVDLTTAHWLRDQGTGLGFDARLESFPLRRRTPVAASATLEDGSRFEGVPLFDGGQTPEGGVTSTLGEKAEQIPVLDVPPFDSLPGARALEALRHTGRHPAILAVTDDRQVLPGLALLNAESFHAPFGPPVLQLSSRDRDALRSARGRRVRIDARFRIEPVEAANVRIDVPGRDPGLAPVVVITPRSGWWHSTSERGGGIALWLDLLRMLADQPPQRPVIFSASTGHELGHLGMQRFLDANEALVRGAHAWIHLGANFATSLHPQVRLQASDSELMDLAGRAMTGHRAAPAVRTAIGARPFGEARDIDAGGGRYISLLGSSGVFHHPGDRWPDMVDLARTTDLAFAFREILGALTRT
jgi:hypothetical protein